MTSRKTDLITVGAVSLSCKNSDFPLWKLTAKGFLNAFPWISRACYTHCLVNICPSRQWIPDCTTQTCCCSSKRLDFCRMVMSFVFEHNQTLFLFSIDCNRNCYAACIYLL